ncbi:hypothetical protein RRG08_039386 [Elysia crispata]|uniref:Uncharacterized protein n=1 Tax=Elysia crispata TaxID=231223 RepID=A0AAE0XV61_9GAST|nr:hypothetical protein RRG08_039386 [Elysia crispata]
MILNQDMGLGSVYCILRSHDPGTAMMLVVLELIKRYLVGKPELVDHKPVPVAPVNIVSARKQSPLPVQCLTVPGFTEKDKRSKRSQEAKNIVFHI